MQMTQQFLVIVEFLALFIFRINKFRLLQFRHHSHHGIGRALLPDTADATPQKHTSSGDKGVRLH